MDPHRASVGRPPTLIRLRSKAEDDRAVTREVEVLGGVGGDPRGGEEQARAHADMRWLRRNSTVEGK